MHWYAGTSGYGFKQWVGSFYPDGIKADAMLAYYAVHLPAVEIDTTFQRFPRAQVLEGWADAVPKDFRFALKAPRQITHELRLVDAGAALAQMTRRLEALDGKLGAVRFQLPAHLHKDIERLRAFAGAIPAELSAAMDFRHPSWFDDEVFDLLSRRGIALCVDDAASAAVCDRVATADWVYLRLGPDNRSDAALLGSSRRAAGAGTEHGFAFFEEPGDGTGAETAARFLRLAAGNRRAAQPPRRASRRPISRDRGSIAPGG
jgi:uncharacterized protein YecE (DUF72 family)